jgi:hypothetical protein
MTDDERTSFNDHDGSAETIDTVVNTELSNTMGVDLWE